MDRASRAALVGLVVVAALAGCGCALLSNAPPEDATLDLPLDGLTPSQLRAFLAGDEAFSDPFTADTGLGPVFNQTSCHSCHPRDGRGHPSTNLLRFGRGDPADAERFDYLLPRGGPQLQDHAIPGYAPERLPDEATARSVRGGPIVAGLGLLEAIPEAALLALADPDDMDGDGVSGRAAYVVPPPWLDPAIPRRSTDGKVLGRLGRKATAADLLQQTVAAYLNDIGITSDLEPLDLFNPQLGGRSGDDVADPEVARGTVDQVVFYLRTLRAPPRRGADDPAVRAGERRFDALGCARCHVPAFRTGASPITALADQPVRLYSDLLLHDLGPALADGFPEGAATGSEWRTTPLWGLGLVGRLLGGTAYYLHDGRTADLAEAIRLHGGEADAASQAFQRLPPGDRDAVLAFLGSL